MTVQQSRPSSTATAASSSDANATKRQFHPLAEYRKELENFSADRQREREVMLEIGGQMNSPGAWDREGLRREEIDSLTDVSCDQPLVDEFLEFVASTGQSHLPWTLIQPVIVWKLQAVIDAVHVKEAEAQRDGLAKEALINDAELRDTKAFLMEKIRSFDGIPFTIQRLCELLIAPEKHYHSTGTYLRAIEKNINVVTTVTENGMRITGADAEEEFEKDAPIRVERNFIVSVDEMDEPLTLKLERQNQHEKRDAVAENQSVCTLQLQIAESVDGSDEGQRK